MGEEDFICLTRTHLAAFFVEITVGVVVGVLWMRRVGLHSLHPVQEDHEAASGETNFCVSVTAAGLELGLPLVAGSVSVQGEPHLPVPRVLLEHVLLLKLLLLA